MLRTRVLAGLTLVALLASPALAQTRPNDSRPPRQGQPPSGNTVDLRPRFKVGQVVRLSMDITSKSEVTGPEADTAGDAHNAGARTVGLELALKCTSADPERGYTLDMTFEALRVEMDVQGERLKYDSRQPGKDEIADAMFAGAVGLTLPVTMDKDGNISNIGGAAGGGEAAIPLGDLAGMIKGLFGPITTRTSGTGQARVNEKWTTDDTMQAGLGTVRLRTDYTLKSAGSSMATLHTKGTFTLDPRSAQPGLRIRDGKYDGDVKWNLAEGMIESMNMKQKLVLEKRDKQGALSTSTQILESRVSRVRGVR